MRLPPPLTGSRRVSAAVAATRYIALLQPRSVWRVILLCIVAASTIVTANMGFAQSSAYPGGVRSEDEWYYCYTQRQNDAGTAYSGTWSDFICYLLLWQETGHGFESVVMEGFVTTDDCVSPGCSRQLRAYVIPPRGMKEYSYRCDAFNRKERFATVFSLDGEASSGAGAFTTTDGTGWAIEASSPSYPSPPNITIGTIDVVGSMRSQTYDRWWTDDVVEDWAGTALAVQSWFVAQVSTISSTSGTSEAGFECQIIDWNNWADWLSGGNEPWVPDEDSMVPDPTPTPGIWPTPINFEITPMLPITNNVEINIGEPGEVECSTIVPGRVYSDTVFGYFVDIGWSPYELCTQPTEITLSLFDIDFGYYLLAVLGVCSIGVVFKLFSRSG